jgi:hypothetical protein
MTNSSVGGAVVLGGGAVEPWTAESILNNMVRVISNSRHHITMWKRGSAISSPPRFTFVLHPELAIELHRLGYDQRSLGAYLFDQTRIPYDGLSVEEAAAYRRRIDEGEIPDANRPLYRENMKSGGRVPLLLRPADCHIVVAGGIPGYSFVTSYFAVPPYSETAIITREITD